MEHLLKVSYSDFKLVFRDPSLRIFLFLPALIYVLVAWVFPLLLTQFGIGNDFVPYVLMGASMQTATMFAFIYTIVLIDEKDTQVAQIYGILPVSKMAFVLARMLIPYLIATLITWLVLQFQPYYELNPWGSMGISAVIGLLAPMFALAVSILSANKMIGMTWGKLLNLVIMLPLAAFFVPERLAWIFGIIPTYWPFWALEQLIVGNQMGWILLVGFGYGCLVIWGLAWAFSRTHFA